MSDSSKFEKIVKELTDIYKANAKCSVQVNFGGNIDNVTLRYINIEAEEFSKIINKGYINGETQGTKTETRPL